MIELSTVLKTKFTRPGAHEVQDGAFKNCPLNYSKLLKILPS